jgi:hypothetical protein
MLFFNFGNLFLLTILHKLRNFFLFQKDQKIKLIQENIFQFMFKASCKTIILMRIYKGIINLILVILEKDNIGLLFNLLY